MRAASLRPATQADAAALAKLATEAFVAAFGPLYRPEDLAAFLAEYRTSDRYRDRLRDPATLIHLVEDGARLAGYCVIVRGHGNDDRPLPRPVRPVFLSQLYTDPAMTGHGYGAALLEWAIAEARGWGADAIQLSVFSENFGAQRFYQRYGFSKVANIEFWVGNHRDAEFLYELAL
ncbi:MAG: GNAT family N-acetyltransferase [Croceibacterium sp.]